MIRDAHLVKKELQGSVNGAVNVADLMRRNKFERKQEKKRNLIFVTAGVSMLAISLFIISL